MQATAYYHMPSGQCTVKIPSFYEGLTRDFIALYKSAQKYDLQTLVIDLRDCPGGRVDEAVLLLAAFLPKGLVVGYLQGIATKKMKALVTRGSYKVAAGLHPVVLVGGRTASAAELFVSALQFYELYRPATIIGYPTFGKYFVHDVDMCTGIVHTERVWTDPLGRLCKKIKPHYYSQTSESVGCLGQKSR